MQFCLSPAGVSEEPVQVCSITWVINRILLLARYFTIEAKSTKLDTYII